MILPRRACTVEFGPSGSTGRSVSGLRTVFQVEHDRASTPSKAVIEVYNLSRESRGLLDGDNATVRLLAGYEPTPLQVFSGEPSKVETRRQGPDIITRIEAEDGGRSWRTARVEVISSTAITWEQVVTRALDSAGLARTLGAGVDFSGELTQGLTYSGSLRALLDRVADSTGADWSIRDGVVVFSTRGGVVAGQSLLLTPQTGLVGSPVRTDDGVEVTALIAPQMRPRNVFTVQAASLSGSFVADRVTFNGDTHGQPWYVIATGRPY